LRISDMTKSSGNSIGTFYTHFASKEDLVQAVARETLTQRFETFEETFKANDLNATEKIIVSHFLKFLFSLIHPPLYAVERFAISPAIWRVSSDGTKGATTDIA
jgi:AcrR family transcriptional regulator